MQPEEPKAKPEHKPRKGLRIVAWVLVGLLALILLLIGSLYIPGVLNAVASKVLPMVEEASGLRISTGDIRLRFPLKLSVEDALVLDMKANGDTMVAARSASLSVNPLGLLKGDISVTDAEVRNAAYRMGGADSLYIAADIDSVGAAASIALNFSKIDVGHADLDGARILLLMGPDTTATPEDTTATSPMRITAGPISLRNIDYRMSMATTNDTIAARIADARLSAGDLLVADTIDIFARSLTLDVDSALYGQRGAVPVAGLDLNWLTLSEAKARVDSFAMHGMDMRVPIRYFNIGQVAGMPLKASGVYSMTENDLSVSDFRVLLNERTKLRANAFMGLDSVAAPVRLDVAAEVYPAVVGKALPAFAPMIAPLPADRPLTLRAWAAGTMDSLRVDTLQAILPGVFSLKGSGRAENLSDFKKLIADVELDGSLVNAAPFKDLVPAGIKLPPLTLKGRAKARGEVYDADLTARTGAGRLALDGRVNARAEGYDVSLMADSFPVAAFMPDLGIGAVTARLDAKGRSFNPLRPGSEATVDAEVTDLGFRGKRLGGVSLLAALKDGRLDATLDSRAAPAALDLKLSAGLAPMEVSWQLAGNIRRVDLLALGLSDSIFSASGRLRSEGFAALSLDTINARATLLDADLRYGSATNLRLDSLDLLADAGQTTAVSLGNNTIHLNFAAESPLMKLADSFGEAATEATAMIEQRQLHVDTLMATLPRFNLSLDAGPGNPAEAFLAPSGISFRNARLTAARDSTLHASALVENIAVGESMRLDTVRASLRTFGDALGLDVNLNNRPGTLDEFARVTLKGRIQDNSGTFFLDQENLEGETGYRLGFNAVVGDSLLALRLTPVNPVIAYKDWTINRDNFIALNPYTYHVHANLDARGDDSRIQLLTTEHNDSDSIPSANDIKLKISDIHIQDWLKLNPFAPPIAGDVNVDLTLSYDDQDVNGKGTASIVGLTYGKKPVGTFDLGLDVNTDYHGKIHAAADLDVNSRKAMTMTGALNDTAARSPLDMVLKVTQFPLEIANPFLPPEYAALSGALNGSMDVTGTFNAMKLNGDVRFDTARIDVKMLGSSFTLDTTAIPVDSNFVRFNEFRIFGSNSNPLRVNGNVDLRRFANPLIDLNLAAKNMQIVKSKKAKGVDLYGRGFIDADVDVKGSLSFLSVDADLAILPQTNLTYQVSDARAVVGLQEDTDIVRFVNFADTSAVVRADSVMPTGMLMVLNANVDVRQGAQFTVDLSADGKNRAQLRAHGILDYSMNPTQPDGRLTGRLTIDGGFFRYSLPVISEKLFTFNQGSYVAFNGPILNPTLHVSAYDEIRANVTRQGENSRLIDFKVSLAVTGTLEQMDVAFDLSTDADISVQNELQSMSQTQRANQAMNLLLYGVYTGQGTTGNANLSGNALYGFLTSQLNTWAANTIKGVDISFGLDQYDRTRNGQTQTATQYSYKVSKSLFNDRFKIVVGGNYSTDADAEENFAQNLISDISFEYMLNDSGSMYVRLFRHTGFESILEGEVTQTGVGFVVKRRIRRLGDIFNFIKAAKQ